VFARLREGESRARGAGQRAGRLAAHEVLRAPFGFSILLGGEVLGSWSSSNDEIRQPDQDLLDMMATIGSQIGQLIERKRAEDALHRAHMELAHVTRVATLGEMTASIVCKTIGIDSQNLDHLYTTKPQGLGMGLAISRSIIDAMAGGCERQRIPTKVQRFSLPCRPVAGISKIEALTN
jgi:hypothetical protein